MPVDQYHPLAPAGLAPGMLPSDRILALGRAVNLAPSPAFDLSRWLRQARGGQSQVSTGDRDVEPHRSGSTLMLSGMHLRAKPGLIPIDADNRRRQP